VFTLLWYIISRIKKSSLKYTTSSLFFFLSFFCNKAYFNTKTLIKLKSCVFFLESLSLSFQYYKNLDYKPYTTKESILNNVFKRGNVPSQLSHKRSLITSFLYVNTLLPTPLLETHFSFNSLYYFNRQANVGTFNTRKLFNVWFNILEFMKNVFFYKISYLFFSSNYFRYESLSLNWNNTKLLKNLWRYTHPFLFFLNNKTSLNNDIYFRSLHKRVAKVCFLVDIQYHKGTIHYMHKFKFVTIGPVPISSNFYTLTLSLPVSNNLFFSNLYFVRLVLKMNKMVQSLNFDELGNF